MIQWFCRRRFLIVVNVFLLFCYHVPLEKVSPSDAFKLCQVWLKMPQMAGEDFKNFVNVFSLFRNYLPSKTKVVLYLNKFESPWLKNSLCEVWLKLAQWFWRGKFLNIIKMMYFCNFVIISPWTKVRPFIWTINTPFTQGCFVPSLFKLVQWFCRRIFLFHKTRIFVFVIYM